MGCCNSRTETSPEIGLGAAGPGKSDTVASAPVTNASKPRDFSPAAVRMGTEYGFAECAGTSPGKPVSDGAETCAYSVVARSDAEKQIIPKNRLVNTLPPECRNY